MTSTPPRTARVSLSKAGESRAPAPEGPRAASASAATAFSRVDGLALVMTRNTFYITNAERMLLVVLGQALFILIMIGVVYRLFEFTDSRDYFFPIQNDNTLIIERPLSEPVFTDEQIRTWAEQAVTRTLTFGHYDHLMRLQNSRVYFTTRGWGTFTQALADAQILERINAVEDVKIRGKNMVVATSLRGGQRATILKKGITPASGRYAWRVELHVNAAFLTPEGQTNTPWTVEVIVIRVPAMESRDGIGINQLVAIKAES